MTEDDRGEWYAEEPPSAVAAPAAAPPANDRDLMRRAGAIRTLADPCIFCGVAAWRRSDGGHGWVCGRCYPEAGDGRL